MNHCYRRIAYDYVCKTKWSNVIKSPFIKNCTEQKLQEVLIRIKNNKDLLLKYNKQSL